MTDNRTTELREKLTERGIEWKDGDAAYETEWSTPDGRHCSAMYWKPTFTVLISGCTPEQAIAATLGSDDDSHTYHVDTIEEICARADKRINELREEYDAGFAAGKKAAELGSGTCEFRPTTDNPPTCSNCGWQADAYDCDWLDSGTYEYDGRFCKSCGALVRKAVER